MASVALVAIGAYTKHKGKDNFNELGWNMLTLSFGATTLIAFGCILSFITFLGCCGAKNENKCMLYLYLFFIGVLVASQIGIGIYSQVNETPIDVYLDKLYVKHVGGGNASSTAIEDIVRGKAFQTSVQPNLKCCGWNSTCGEFKNSVPLGCGCQGTEHACEAISAVTGCSSTASNITPTPTEKRIFTIPCRKVLLTFIDDNKYIVLIGVCVVAFIELLGIGLTCAILFGGVKDDDFYA